MGNCTSSNRGDPDQKRRNAEIDKQLKNDRVKMEKEMKILLLGAGEAGKSTVLKQMKLIHEGSYSAEEREVFKEIIFSNTIQSMKVILDAMEMLKIDFENEAKVDQHIQFVKGLPNQIEGDTMPKEVSQAIIALWNDQGVQKCYERSNEYQLNDSAKYYFDSIDRISKPDFIPSDQDVLRSRVKTTGITESKFKVKDLTYRMFDVGGQRSERKKWIHCFENVTCVLFLVAISAYDQMLLEDETVNRMSEALQLFESICNSKWFVETSMVLFLNKIDIFKEKIKVSPITEIFPEYTGPNTYEATSGYITEKFCSLNRSPKKTIYPYLTCATDTNQIEFVMSAVNDIIVQSSLRDAGLL